ncbi:thioesterase [Nitrospira sp. KM1]|nr:thioesterase [Nitrospira sp. KM1]
MLTTAGRQSWIVTCRRAEGVRVVGIPYAGGGPAMFRSWAQELPSNIELCAVQLPGREGRMKEEPIRDLRDVVDELAEAITGVLDRPIVLFGHSIGGLIAFELTRELRRRYGFEPVHLFVSGCPAPQSSIGELLYDLPDAEFLEHMRRFNGTPKEVLEHPELMQLLLPVLRADFALRDTYEYREEPPLDCPISCFGGMDDREVDFAKLEGWRRHTNGSFEWTMFQGDHFFVRSSQTAVLDALSLVCTRATAQV